MFKVITLEPHWSASKVEKKLNKQVLHGWKFIAVLPRNTTYEKTKLLFFEGPVNVDRAIAELKGMADD